MEEVEYHTVDQGTPEWFDLRAGCLTGSHAQAIASAGKGLETYILEILAEKHSLNKSERYENEDLKRGKDLEPQARAIYEMETGHSVELTGFVKYKNKNAGASPDGLVNEDGLVEIKCHNDKNHVNLIIKGADEIEAKYLWQMQMQMLLTGRKWTDYVAYNPNFTKNILIHRIDRDEAKIELLKTGITKGLELLKTYETKI